MWIDRAARRACLLVLAIACVLLGTSKVAHAFEVKTTASGLPLYWPSASVAFETDASVDLLPRGAAAAIGSAIQAWSGSGAGPTLSVTPAASPSQPGYDGRNVIYFAPAGYPLAGNALAITIVTYDDTTGQILDTDIVLNGIYAFAILPDGSTAAPGAPQVANEAGGAAGSFDEADVGQFDVAHVVAHETGHALGMDDEMVNPSPLMFLYTQPGDASRRAPTSDDFAGIAELYADASAQRGCSGSTMSPKRPRPRMWMFVGAIVVLGAFLRRRRS